MMKPSMENNNGDTKSSVAAQSEKEDYIPTYLTNEDVAKMEKKFGTTTDVRDAYFIMPDGKWLDFSNIPENMYRQYSHWGPEHPCIGFYYNDRPSTVVRDAVVKLGMIRVVADSQSSLMEIGKKPNAAQYESIRNFLDELTEVMYEGEGRAIREEDDPRFILEIERDGFSKTYNVDQLDSVIPDIRKFYSGIMPRQQSVVQMFHESVDAKTDEEYLRAAHSKQKSVCRNMVLDAATKAMPNTVLKKNGHPEVLFHGTCFDFVRFYGGLDNIVWLTNSMAYADCYADPARHPECDNEGIVMRVFANVEKVANIGDINEDFSDEGVARIAKAIGTTYEDLKRQIGKYSYAYLYEINEYVGAIARKNGFDALFAMEGDGTGQTGTGFHGKAFTVGILKPELIKSAAPITYDDNKNVIPLSKRFNFNVEDIREDDEECSTQNNLAPNGKPSNLPPNLYRMVRTENFKRWFGDWENDPENSSRIVDENGEPMVVYRGQSNDWSRIAIGSYFTENRRFAKHFGHVNSYFLNFRRPYVVDAGFDTFEQIGVDKFDDGDIERYHIRTNSDPDYDEGDEPRESVGIDALAGTFMFDPEEKFDSLIVKNCDDEDMISNQYVNFDESQVKSVDNCGDFNPKGNVHEGAVEDTIADYEKHISTNSENPDCEPGEGWFMDRTGEYLFCTSTIDGRIMLIDTEGYVLRRDKDNNPLYFDDPADAISWGRKRGCKVETDEHKNFIGESDGEPPEVPPTPKKAPKLESPCWKNPDDWKKDKFLIEFKNHCGYPDDYFPDKSYRACGDSIAREYALEMPTDTAAEEIEGDAVMLLIKSGLKEPMAVAKNLGKIMMGERKEGRKHKNRLQAMRKAFMSLRECSSRFDTEDVIRGISESEETYQGMTTPKADVRNIVKKHLWNATSEIGVRLVDFEIHGSRGRGTARPDSDLDVVFEYDDGDTDDFTPEDYVFNCMRNYPLEIDGIKVDFNPINADKTGSLDEYMERDRAYDEEKKREHVSEDEGGDSTGVSVEAWHGTHHAGFDEFDKSKVRRIEGNGFFFAGSREVAMSYAGHGKSSGVYHVRLYMDNPLIIDAEGGWWGDLSKAIVYQSDGKTPTSFTVGKMFGYGNSYTDRLAKHCREHTKFDGIIIRNVMDWGTNATQMKKTPGMDYIVFEPEQIEILEK